MRIESWGRFSVYVARIRNFGEPHPIARGFVLAHMYARARARACTRGACTEQTRARRGRKNGYVWLNGFDL
jgi:hypothetical protein